MSYDPCRLPCGLMSECEDIRDDRQGGMLGHRLVPRRESLGVQPRPDGKNPPAVEVVLVVRVDPRPIVHQHCESSPR
jgi:hypothetical protein